MRAVDRLLPLIAIFMGVFLGVFFGLASRAETPAVPPVAAVAPTPARRIVTLSPVAAEWVAELLGEKETKQRLVGVSEYSQYPKYLETLPSVGSYPQIQVESVLRLKPEVVIAVESTNRPDQIEKLRRLKLPVTVLPKEDFNRMGEWILALGRALHEEKRAEALKSRWEFELKSLEPVGKSARIFLQIQSRPLITIGGGSFMTEAFRRVGFDNVFDDLAQDYPKVSREAVIKLNPDQIWILDLTGNRQEFERERAEWEKISALKAVKDEKVRILKGDDYARCSMRLLKALKSLH